MLIRGKDSTYHDDDVVQQQGTYTSKMIINNLVDVIIKLTLTTWSPVTNTTAFVFPSFKALWLKPSSRARSCEFCIWDVVFGILNSPFDIWEIVFVIWKSPFYI